MAKTVYIPTEPTAAPDSITGILQGDAIFTLRMVAPRDPKYAGERFTYRVRRVKFFDELLGVEVEEYNVRVLTGPNNLSDYTYALSLDLHNYQVKKYGKKIGPNAHSVKLFLFFIERLRAHKPVPEVEFFLAGRCMRCGLPLTDPKSIMQFYGPDCITKVWG